MTTTMGVSIGKPAAAITAIHKLFDFLPPLPCLLTTPAEEREKNRWERAAKHKAYGGTVAYMDKIPHGENSAPPLEK